MKTRRLAGLVLVLFFGGVSIATAVTRYVNVSNAAPAAPYTNWAMAATAIQPAIDAAASGDEILVAPGTYSLTGTEVNIPPGKALTLSSTLSRAAVIDAQGLSRGMTIEGANSWVAGFTIRNGSDLGHAGGGVYLLTNCVVQDCLVASNRATSGGGVYVVSGAIVQDCEIVGNQADFGGGAEINAGGLIQRCTVASNAAAHGGGIELYEAGTAAECLIEGNVAGSMGGGVVFYSGQSGLVRDCVIRGNAVTNLDMGVGGGGIHIQQSGVVSNCWITGNSVASTNGWGGGVLMDSAGQTSTGRLVNAVVSGNWAGGLGGGVYSSGPLGAVQPVINCTIVSNSAGRDGGGAWAYTTRFINDIIYFNSAPTNANLNAHDEVLSCIVSNCCTTSNYFWPNITNAPTFVDAGAGDFRLATASFCIDAGTTNGAPRTDIEGNPRPRRGVPGMGNTNCDMGAYEYGFHFNSIEAVSSNAVRLRWDVQDVGRYRLDIATNAAADPAHPAWNVVMGYTQATILGLGQFAVYETTVTNPIPPMPGRGMFRLRIDRATPGKRRGP